MAKKAKKIKKVILEEEDGAKNKLREGDFILYSFATHIEKTQVKNISKNVAILANGVRVFKRYNERIIREDGRPDYMILPWTDEAESKWEHYTLSLALNQKLETLKAELKAKSIPLEKLRKYNERIEKIMNR